MYTVQPGSVVPIISYLLDVSETYPYNTVQHFSLGLPQKTVKSLPVSSLPESHAGCTVNQCCGTVMICCGLVPTVSAPDPNNLQHFIVFQQQKFEQNLAFSTSESALVPGKSASHLDFLTFFYSIYVRSGSKSGSGTVLHSGSGSSKAVSYDSCGSDSTTIL